MPERTADVPSHGTTTRTEHYGNGALKFSGSSLDGEMHGEWTWYRTDGSVMRTGAFDRGRQIGTWRTYDRTGRVVKETAFDRAASGPASAHGD